MNNKRLLVIFAVILIGFGLFLFRGEFFIDEPVVEIPKVVEVVSPVKSIGQSTEGRDILAYSYGTGEREIMFVGGIHGGYEWNTVLLAYRMMDYFSANQAAIPATVKITVIPVLNPDGYYKITGTTTAAINLATIPEVAATAPGRFNANGVDLNRNFDCIWQPEAKWRDQTVSAGTAAFSERETAAFRDLVLKKKPAVVIFAHSASNGVFGAGCNAPIATSTRAVMSAYSTASGYPMNDTFSQYVVTGDASDWLSTIGVPSIGAELKGHETVEWEQNLAGMKAVVNLFAL